MTRVLVAYGSRRGSTAEIAGWIGDTLRDQGLEAEVADAGAVRDVTPYDAVVLGGALYAGRWHKDARRFARRHAAALSGRPVWLFSSGPLDRSADEAEIPPVPQAARASAALGAREHRTFGGRLARDAEGFLASRIAERTGGDYRDPDGVCAWARQVAEQVAATRGTEV
ncbi:flavodoxin [Microbispora cellulosiformans]|uniref:Flavodoxin n=1 Tax=Microbispora cellulosiformans TaxID=2614688 RepID=A0A5J5JVY3_9ACTN|nr:flavodoxin domain-containing protein [Microbispora cellulosiformans]KAA9375482.1 flavodoxin [Microbispora cellulosiformans]